VNFVRHKIQAKMNCTYSHKDLYVNVAMNEDNSGLHALWQVHLQV